jgi:hypothetical protein
MEFEILTVLDFNLTFPTSFRFLQRFVKIVTLNTPSDEEKDEELFHMSQYLLELSIMEYRMLKFSNSLKAASATYLAMKILKRGVNSRWQNSLIKATQYEENQLRQCAKDMCALLQGVDTCSLQAIKRKFSKQKFSEVAKIKLAFL